MYICQCRIICYIQGKYEKNGSFRPKPNITILKEPPAFTDGVYRNIIQAVSKNMKNYHIDLTDNKKRIYSGHKINSIAAVPVHEIVIS